MNVELLWWEGCPSTDRALAAVHEALSDLGLDDAGVRTREIKDDGTFTFNRDAIPFGEVSEFMSDG